MMCSIVLWSQTNVEKDAFIKYTDSCNVEANKHYSNKDYDGAIKILDALKNRYDKLDQKTRKELNLEKRIYYAYAAFYAAKDDKKSTMENLDKVVQYGYNEFDISTDPIYSIYKDNQAFKKYFMELLELRHQYQADTISLPWHLTDILTHLKQNERFEKLEIDFSILSDIQRDMNLYIAPLGYGNINNHGFYGGIQTKVNGMGKRGLIFSRWDERDKRAIKSDTTGFTCSSGNEGDFISVRKPFEWSRGQYKISLTVEPDTLMLHGKVHRWVTMSIYSYATKQKVINGSLAFPGDSLILDKDLYIFVELYGSDKSKLAIKDIPEMHFSFDRFVVNGIVQVQSGDAFYWMDYPRYADTTYKDGKIFVTAGKKFPFKNPRLIPGRYVEPIFDEKDNQSPYVRIDF